MEILWRKYNTERGAESKYCWDLLRWHLCSAVSYCDLQFPLPTGVGKLWTTATVTSLTNPATILITFASNLVIGRTRRLFFCCFFKSYFPSSWCDLKRTDRLWSSPRPSSPLQMKQKWEIPATLILGQQEKWGSHPGNLNCKRGGGEWQPSGQTQKAKTETVEINKPGGTTLYI